MTHDEDRQAALLELRALLTSQRNSYLFYENKNVWTDDDRRIMRDLETSQHNLRTAIRLLEREKAHA